MSKNSGFPQGIEMAALKKQTAEVLDLMRPGNGTPWEDRGSTGAVGAYFQTALKGMTSPALLLDHIRRPETTSDAASFGYVSIAMWVIGVLIWNVYWLYFFLPHHDTEYFLTDATYYWLTAILQAGLVGAGLFFWVKIGSQMYTRLTETELKGVTPSLVYNCFAYSLAPSLLAVVPVFGWGIAFVWILANQIIAGKRRLYVKNSSAIINPLIIAFCVLASAIIAYYFLGWLWSSHLEMGGVTHLALNPL